MEGSIRVSVELSSEDVRYLLERTHSTIEFVEEGRETGLSITWVDDLYMVNFREYEDDAVHTDYSVMLSKQEAVGVFFAAAISREQDK